TLVALYHFDPGRYVRWRNTFLLILVVALVGFWFYPLMPPRLLPPSFGFVDTRLVYFTIGKPVPHSQETGAIYAAIPSLHIAWSTWSAFALWPLVRPYWARALLASYPVLMLFAIVVTANHFFLDAVGAWVVLAVAYTLARWRDWWPWRLKVQSAASLRDDRAMKHATSGGLDELGEPLSDLRGDVGLTGKSGRVVFPGSPAFLRVHPHPA